KLGVESDEERFYVVEHVLLRPVAGDAFQDGPLMRAPRVRDPYSLQISVVFPSWPARYRDDAFRRFVEQTVIELTPAHLTAYVVWKDKPAMEAFAAAHAAWRERLRASRRAGLGL